MGLPHVVVRFYTNPDGRAARRTTLVVLALLGLFYLLPPIYGALGRIYAPELAGSGRSDALVLELPRIMVDGPARRGADRAGHRRRVRGVPVDVVGAVDRGGRRAEPGRHRPAWGGRRLGGVAAFRLARRRRGDRAVRGRAAGARTSASPAPSGWPSRWPPSTFCPLLLLGIWWRGLTDAGAIAGLVVGGARLRRSPSPGRSATPEPVRLGRRAAGPAGRLDGPARARHDGRRLAGSPGHRSRPTPAGSWCGCTRPRRVELDRG